MRVSLREQVADYLRAREGKWIPAIAFESIGGRQGWRTRISQCRRAYGMQIDNRQRIAIRADGSRFTLSEYRYLAEGSESGARGQSMTMPSAGSTAFVERR